MRNEKEKLMNEPERIWRQGSKPYRSLIFWGWNEKDEPSFLIIYGIHNFKEEISYFIKDRDTEKFENILCDNVTYTSYAVFNGKKGHLPSLKMISNIEGKWIYNIDKMKKEKKKLNDYSGITIPYYKKFTYNQLVNKVIESDNDFGNFKFAKNPNEVLQLNENLKDYVETLYVIMSNRKEYMRNNKLKELMDSCIEKEVYNCIFKFGSCELLCELFLEGAKRNVEFFKSEAEYILNNDVHYAEDTYINDLKRYAKLYLNSINEEKREERKQWIYDNLEKVDLPLKKIDGAEIPKGTTFDGAAYRKFAYQLVLWEYDRTYVEKEHGEGGWIIRKKPDIYEKGPFNNGLVFDMKSFESIIQEAEVYGMADVIGRIAYFIDAPRLHYYFKGNGFGKQLDEFKKYICKILMNYGKNNPDKFMEAIKVLFTSYTRDDFLCRARGNFQFNYFIRNILYFTFKEKPSDELYNWREQSEWMGNDQLLALEGRYEYMKEVWDSHLEDVLYIAANAKISTVLKACYFILKENYKAEKLIEKMTYDEIMKLYRTTYEPLAQMAMEIFEKKLSREEKLDCNTISNLINDSNQERIKHADSMFADNIEEWADYVCENIRNIDEESYISFLKSLINTN